MRSNRSRLHAHRPNEKELNNACDGGEQQRFYSWSTRKPRSENEANGGRAGKYDWHHKKILVTQNVTTMKQIANPHVISDMVDSDSFGKLLSCQETMVAKNKRIVTKNPNPVKKSQ